MNGRPATEGPARSPAGPIGVAVGCATALTLLALLVAGGAMQQLDEQVSEIFRPDDVWGSAQLRADLVVEGLRPTRVLPVTVLITVVVGMATRSWRPVVLATGLLGTTIVLTLALKELVGRPDPHGHVPAFGGSFPSGHVAVLMVCTGLVVLLLGAGARRWAGALVMLAGSAMALALLLQAAHWASDVLGGALISAGTLTGCVAVDRTRARREGPAAGHDSGEGPRISADNRRS